MIFDLKNIERCAIAIAERKNIDIGEAIGLLTGSRLSLIGGTELLTSYSLQLAFMTCYNAGSRIFRGGVEIDIPSNIPNLLSSNGNTFNELLETYFPSSKPAESAKDIPTICFGRSPSSPNEIEVICTDWSGGLNIFENDEIKPISRGKGIPVGACLAASYALFWAFNFQFRMVENTFDQSFIYSLWDNKTSLLGLENTEDDTPEVNFIPDLWIVGLGHLGQAYLWLLANLKGVNAFKTLLQDDDSLGVENLGSQMVSFENQIGMQKTRVCSSFLEKAGIHTQIIEKKFSNLDQQDPMLNSYKVLLTGLDNPASRRQINPKRFVICLDGATNGHLANFDSFTFRNLGKSQRQPHEIWPEVKTGGTSIMHKNIFKMVEEKGGCGQLTEYGISTPFVGLFGASILIAELLKEIVGSARNSVFTGKLGTLESYVPTILKKDICV